MLCSPSYLLPLFSPSSLCHPHSATRTAAPSPSKPADKAEAKPEAASTAAAVDEASAALENLNVKDKDEEAAKDAKEEDK